MYYRIKNKLDAECMSEYLLQQSSDNQLLADRILDITETLDIAYGKDRSSYAVGGYILFFMDSKDYDMEIEKVLQFHKLDADLYEYSDVLEEREGQEWREELFLLSSEDSLVLIHPREV